MAVSAYDLFFELFFGTTKANAVLVSVNWRLAPPEIAYIVQDSEARGVIAQDELCERIDASRDSLPVPPHALHSDPFVALPPEALDALGLTCAQACPEVREAALQVDRAQAELRSGLLRARLSEPPAPVQMPVMLAVMLKWPAHKPAMPGPAPTWHASKPMPPPQPLLPLLQACGPR